MIGIIKRRCTTLHISNWFRGTKSYFITQYVLKYSKVPPRDITVDQFATYWTTSATRLTYNLCLYSRCGLFPSSFVSKFWMNIYIPHARCVSWTSCCPWLPYFHIRCKTKIKNLIIKFLPFRKQYLFTYLLTHSLTQPLTHSFTPWNRVHLGKLTGSQLVKKFPALYGTRRFNTAFTSARRRSLSWISYTITSKIILFLLYLNKSIFKHIKLHFTLPNYIQDPFSSALPTNGFEPKIYPLFFRITEKSLSNVFFFFWN